MLRDPSAIVELLVHYVVYNDRMLSGVTEGAVAPGCSRQGAQNSLAKNIL